MLIFFLIFLTFIGSILAYNPHSESLKNTKKMSFNKRIYHNKGTLILGGTIIIAYFFSMSDESYSTSEKMIYLFGLSYTGIFEHLLLYQLLTSIFVHIDLYHLCGNLLCIALLSSYERRAGVKKFILIFFFSGIASSFIDLICLSPNTVSIGASAGICGLVSGYFIDYPKTSWKEWLLGLTFVLLIIGVSDFFPDTKASKLSYEINWFAHLVGATAGAIWIKYANNTKFIKNGNAT